VFNISRRLYGSSNKTSRKQDLGHKLYEYELKLGVMPKIISV